MWPLQQRQFIYAWPHTYNSPCVRPFLSVCDEHSIWSAYMGSYMEGLRFHHHKIYHNHYFLQTEDCLLTSRKIMATHNYYHKTLVTDAQQNMFIVIHRNHMNVWLCEAGGGRTLLPLLHILQAVRDQVTWQDSVCVCYHIRHKEAL